MKRWLTVMTIVMFMGIAAACGDGGTSDATAQEKSVSGDGESSKTAEPTLTENEFAKLMFSIGSYCSSATCAQKQYKKTMTCTSGSSGKNASGAFGGAYVPGLSEEYWDGDAINSLNSAFLKTKEFCDQKFISGEREYSENVKFTTDSVAEFCQQAKKSDTTEINKTLVSSETSISSFDLVTQIFCHNVDFLLNDEQ